MAGARTQLYNFFVAMAVLFTILFLDSLFYYLPKVVLASIIIVAAVGTSLSLQPFFVFLHQAEPCCRRPGRVRGPGLPVEDP